MLTWTICESDATAYILGMLRTDHRIGVQRVPVAVQACDLYAGAFKQAEEVVSRHIPGEGGVEGGDVYWRQEEPPELSLDAGEAEFGNNLDCLRQ